MAERLMPNDRQRLTRALEVLESTGKSLSYWQKQPGTPILKHPPVEKIVVAIEREALYERCDRRFDLMMQNGALEEVEQLLAANIPETMPAMRALGVRSVAAYLRGEIDKDLAIEKAKTETRQYAKRQMTWQKGNMITWNWSFK
jgi:tRNA dimethylallyltransferase